MLTIEQSELTIWRLKLCDIWPMIRLRELHVGPKSNRFIMQQFVVDL